MPRLLALATLTSMLIPNLLPAADNLARFAENVYLDSAGHKLPYRLLSPAKIEPGRKYPLVVFLHGAGERGTDNKKQLVHGMNDFASDEIMAKYPAFVIAPQCPDGKKWVEVDWSADRHTMPEKPSESLGACYELIQFFGKTQPVDPQRIYITGLSMGGYGTWDALQRWPDLFAAAAPICGGGDPAGALKMKDIPIWAFHGDADTAVKVHRSREMIKAIEAAGGKPKYTEYAKVGHNSWSRTYADPALYEWLFAQKKP